MKKKLKILENSKKTLFLLVLTLVFVFLLKGEIVLAAEEEFPVTFTPQVSVGEFVAGEPETVTGTTLANYIDNFYKWSIRAIAIIAIIMIMVAGFQWMTAGGNASTIDQAKKRMSSALMGLILVLGAQFLLNFINPSLTVFRSLDLQPIEEEELLMYGDMMNGCPIPCREDELCFFGGVGVEPICADNLTMKASTILEDGQVISGTGPLLPAKSNKYCGTLDFKVTGLNIETLEALPEFRVGIQCDDPRLQCVIRGRQYNEDNPFFVDLDKWKSEDWQEVGHLDGTKCLDPSLPYIGPFGTTYEWKCVKESCEKDFPGEWWTYQESTCEMVTGKPRPLSPWDCEPDENGSCCGSRPPWGGY